MRWRNARRTIHDGRAFSRADGLGDAQAGLSVAVTYWLCRATDDERTRCRLWSLCSLLLLADLAAAFLLPHLRLFQPWTVVSTTMVSELFVLERQAGRVVFVVWLCGALGAVGLLMTQSIRMLRFLRSCQPLDENLLPPLADDTSALPSAALARQRTGIVPIVLQSPVLPVPVCWQWDCDVALVCFGMGSGGVV